MHRVRLGSFFTALALLFTLACDDAETRPPLRGAPPITSGPDTVVFVVLDTVRSDNASICGYDRPTTPTLANLIERGAAHTCRAYAPSSWTLPSHASFFTATEPLTHGVGAPGSGATFAWGTVRPLGPELPTIAEQFRSEGFETILLSANPAVSDDAGLTRGFGVVEVAGSFDHFRGPQFVERFVRLWKNNVQPDEPVFLFLNMADAHDPWSSVPEDVDWVEPRPELNGRINERAYDDGELSEEEGRALLAHATDVYDWGISRADQLLGAVLEELRRGGRDGRRLRLVVTSDHGEYLGAHGRLLHGGPGLFEEVTRVPFVYYEPGAEIALPEPLAAMTAHPLLRTGQLPTPSMPVRASTFSIWRDEALVDSDADAPCPQTTAATWEGTRKLTCLAGRIHATDLALDPDEAAPVPAPESEARERLSRFARRTEACRRQDDPGDDQLAEQLRALGYLRD
jgi:arylsulfatase A-like enzyme